MLYFFFNFFKKLILFVIHILFYPNLGLEFQAETALKPYLDICDKKRFDFDFNELNSKDFLNNETLLYFLITFYNLHFGIYFILASSSTNPKTLKNLTKLGLESWDPSSIGLLGCFLFTFGIVFGFMFLCPKVNKFIDSELDKLSKAKEVTYILKQPEITDSINPISSPSFSSIEISEISEILNQNCFFFC